MADISLAGMAPGLLAMAMTAIGYGWYRLELHRKKTKDAERDAGFRLPTSHFERLTITPAAGRADKEVASFYAQPVKHNWPKPAAAETTKRD